MRVLHDRQAIRQIGVGLQRGQSAGGLRSPDGRIRRPEPDGRQRRLMAETV